MRSRNLVPKVLSIPLITDPGCSWSCVSQNWGDSKKQLYQGRGTCITFCPYKLEKAFTICFSCYYCIDDKLKLKTHSPCCIFWSVWAHDQSQLGPSLEEEGERSLGIRLEKQLFVYCELGDSLKSTVINDTDQYFNNLSKSHILTLRIMIFI